ncbi:MAG: hypothetical protein J5590_08270 [Clostridia bacterium]|nr:hypothetical protein [Clostridia bacterium]
MDKKIIFHIPHDGHEFPAELMESVSVPEDEFLMYHRKMSDTRAGGFAPRDVGGETFAFPVSRLLCDVERFIDGSETMGDTAWAFAMSAFMTEQR